MTRSLQVPLKNKKKKGKVRGKPTNHYCIPIIQSSLNFYCQSNYLFQLATSALKSVSLDEEAISLVKITGAWKQTVLETDLKTIKIAAT